MQLLRMVLVVSALLLAVQRNTGEQETNPPVVSAPRALALGWGGVAEIDTAWPTFARGDFTVQMWVMPQFPHAYAGPLLTDQGGAVVLGQGDYRWGDGGFKRQGDPIVFLWLGGAGGKFAAPEWQGGKWINLALVRQKDKCTLYLNSRVAGELAVPSNWKPQGKLRLGRLGRGALVSKDLVGADRWNTSGYEGQFFGLVDDVLVFDHALTLEELQVVAAGRSRGEGNTPQSICTFDLDRGWTARIETRSASVDRAARAVAVSDTRDADVDAAALLIPSSHVDLRLPVISGKPWLVVQGFADPAGSHNGYAAFCLDLIRAGAPSSASRGESILSAASGRVATWLEEQPGGGNRANFISIRHVDGLYASYLHLEQSSITRCFQRTKSKDVVKGQTIATVGDSGTESGNVHLHFALTDGPDDGKQPIVTIPFSLSDYSASDDEGKTWHRVERGVPTRGQWIKREK